MAETERSNLVWLSRIMALLSAIGMVLAPLGDAAAFLWPGTRGGLDLNVDHMNGLLSDAVPLQYRLGALAFSLTEVALVVWALWSLRKLFLCYARGEVFAPTSLNLLNHVAVALFASVVVTFAMQVPISLILSIGLGKPQISLDFGSNDAVTLFTAGVVLVIARVMNEAGRIAEENAKFV
ncbi:MAG: DUF2975 domain-containing protein [Proteobacteria bacterium]|nr:DUF2975 domain-containing protein [Pseudomonadota bacterium]